MTNSDVVADVAELRLDGELDISNANSLRSVLSDLGGSTAPPRILVDLSKLAACDSTGLSVFVAAAKHCAEAGGWLRLTKARPHVARLLVVTGLTALADDDGLPLPGPGA
ncbi:STAS domain-containing protein [Phytomonospora endophytica]|uniref:Anti-sigma factor antagonist n=1 Tax=Phytomonospora endophytica TaxID=714109 RepID=A0A841G1K0_9ACTN|nr:STAS domain-containing protein [Phytomonospora endophytica]MBB6038549.1 anti-anti-sigma factor [Phytomonospora endophytica]